MLRLPTCALNAPMAEEMRNVFRKSKAVILSYAVDACPDCPANALLYLCADREYSLDKLAKNARYDVRRGLKEFEIRPLGNAEIVRLGKIAYCDTLRRTGRSPDHRDKFETAFARPRHDRYFLGALRMGRLAAFIQVVAVNDWVSLGGYSADEFLPLCPNNALIFYAVQHAFRTHGVRVVDYGFSSIQTVSNADGLHRFKVKMGFQAVPVRRNFAIHPLLRPFANRVLPGIVKRLLRVSPNHPLLTKADGALRVALEGQTT
jgi:hypothetical protein